MRLTSFGRWRVRGLFGSRSMFRLSGFILLASLVLTSGCFGRSDVVRVVRGQSVRGRYIDERAYEAYLRGAIAEQHSKFEDAEQAYATVVDADPEGVDPLVRLGAVRCARGVANLGPAMNAFRAALRLDPNYGPAYIERARCYMRSKDWTSAEKDARGALAVDPMDLEASVVLAQVLEASGRVADAVVVTDALVIWLPQSVQAWRAAEALATRRRDETRRTYASDHVQRLLVHHGSTPRPMPVPEALQKIDRALCEGAAQQAQNIAVQARLSSATVALRAAALGLFEMAYAEATRLLAADPSDLDAWCALVASEPAGLRDNESRQSVASFWTERMGTDEPHQPSPLAALVFAEHLYRWLGKDAASAFLHAYGHVPETAKDPLIAAMVQRLVPDLAYDSSRSRR